MAATYEQLIGAGMSEAQARLLANDQQRARTRDPMAVAIVATVIGVSLTALLGGLAWLALSVTDLRTEVTLLQESMARLEESQTRLEEKVDALANEVAEIRALLVQLLP